MSAYAEGAFPMADPVSGELGWYCPDPRAVLAIDPNSCPPGTGSGLHVPRSLRRALNRGDVFVTTNRAFARVIRACAEPRVETENASAETWIDGRIIGLFAALHRAGHAHSVEAWSTDDRPPRLIGGVYGLAVGRVFAAESMFTKRSDAGKIALIALVRHLESRGFTLMDTQFVNPHVRRFGVVEIPSSVYLDHLSVSLGPVGWLGEAGLDVLHGKPPGAGDGSAADQGEG